MERAVFDENGQLLTASFMDYCMPRADNLPELEFETRNIPSTTNPMGLKGAGEAGSIGSTPAVMNAVADALWRAYRIEHIDMPATPFAVYSAIKSLRRQGIGLVSASHLSDQGRGAILARVSCDSNGCGAILPFLQLRNSVTPQLCTCARALAARA